MRPGICYIVGAGSFSEALAPASQDFVIAADGGYAHLQALGIAPDLALGDFDSLGAAPDAPNVERVPPEKDDTDMMLAVRRGLALGYGRFAICGGLGGRLDHTLANAQALCFLASQGARGFLVGEGVVLTVVQNNELLIPAGKTGLISVFCMGNLALGVTLQGLKYPLTEAALENTNPIGVSNEFTGQAAKISVREGMLLVLWHERGARISELFAMC